MTQLELFQYDQLEQSDRDFVQGRTAEIKVLVKRTAQDIIEIGLKLIEVKGRLQHGMFGKWLDSEFGWTDRTALNFMRVANRFKSEIISDLKISPTVLYFLAAPSTPDEVREEAIDRATQGETITHKTAKIIVENSKHPENLSDEEEEEEEEEDLSPLIYDGSYAYCKYCYEIHDRWDLSGDHDPDAWECRNCRHFTTDQNMEIMDKPEFECPECDQIFSNEVWHCDFCDHHWQLSQRDCPNCYQDKLDKKGKSDIKRIKQDAPIIFNQVKTGEISIARAKQKIARANPPHLTETPPIPDDKYRCIVIDPPWPMKKIEREERPNQGIELDYPVMSLDDIKALPVNTLGHADGCHLYLWVTQKYLPFGLELVKAWGFKYQCLMTWRKNVGITPFSWMYDTEHVIFAKMGSLPLTQLGLRLSFDAKVKGHSVKPDTFFDDRVLLASPEPRLEMFARKERNGFAVWGNEV